LVHYKKLFNKDQYKTIKQQNEDINIRLLEREFKPISNTKLDEDKYKIRMHNHLESNFHLSNKKALFYNIKKFMEVNQKDPFSILPLTFHIRQLQNLEEDEQYKQFS